MSQNTERRTRASGLLTTPAVRYTLDGNAFDPSAMVWKIRAPGGPLKFDFISLPYVSEHFRIILRDAFASLLLANASERLCKKLSRIRIFLRYIGAQAGGREHIEELTLADFLNYEASLPVNRSYVMRQLKEALLTLSSAEFPGIRDDLRRALPSIETKGHQIGHAVKTMDLKKGPLTDIEYESLTSGVRQAYADGVLSLENYAIATLGISLGTRPLQLAMIKVKDLKVATRSSGERVHILRVTRLKQGKGIRPRTYFRDRPLDPDLGALLERQCDAMRQWASTVGLDEEEAPMFLSDATKDNIDDPEVSLAPGYEGHTTGEQLSSRMTYIFSKLGVISERTGDALHIFQTRVRRTFGTRLAAEGYDARVIAELMDHTWEKSSLVYIETRPEMIERVDKAIAFKIAPLAQAFLGKIIDVEPGPDTADAVGGVVHRASRDGLSVLGGCGKRDFCGLAAPLACYTCALFNPWVDGPHEELLDELLAEREEMLQIADQRIAAINDRTIFAVAEVIRRCRAASANGGK